MSSSGLKLSGVNFEFYVYAMMGGAVSSTSAGAHFLCPTDERHESD
jgi:hypothetical protein